MPKFLCSTAEEQPQRNNGEPAYKGFLLTERDRSILELLTIKVNFASDAQLARALWPASGNSARGAKIRLQALRRAGFIERFVTGAHPELKIEQPVLSWRPGDELPNFGSLSYRLRSRWSHALQPIHIYTASDRLGRRYAGRGGGIMRPLQATHDLHVTAVYLRLLKENPAEAKCWVSDTTLAPLRRGQKLPDAEIQDANGRTLKVIEFGGSYPPERLTKVHADCERRQVPYELW